MAATSTNRQLALSICPTNKCAVITPNSSGSAIALPTFAPEVHLMTPIKAPSNRADVLHAVSQHTKPSVSPLPERIASMDHAITVPQLSELLHLGRTAVYDLVKRQAIPYFRIGYNVRFDPSEIARWLRDKSLTEIERMPEPVPTAVRATSRNC